MSNISTFGAFTSARLGMYAAMKGLSVTGQNISNINTRGYSRQVLDQRALKLNGTDRYYSLNDANVGSGVLCTGVSQLRDPYLDIRYRNEQSSVGSMDSKLAGLEELSQLLDEVGKGEGFGVIEKAINDLVEQLNGLTQTPNSQTQDGLVQAKATTLLTLLNNYAKDLGTIAKNQSDAYDQDITTVNGILENIRGLNETIQKNEIHGDKALELRDQRNLLLDQLSNYMKVDITYSTDEVAPNTFVEKLTVTLDDGSTPPTALVDGLFSGKLSLDKTNRPDLTLEVSALQNRQGRTHPTYGTPAVVGSDIYGALESTRKILTDAGEFTIDATTGLPAPTTDRGIPYYQNAMNALANRFASAMNDANRPYEVDAEGFYLDNTGARLTDGGVELNQKDDLTNTQRDFIKANANRLGGILFSNSNTGNDDTGITAANISISSDWTAGRTKIQVSDVAGSTNPTNIAHIIFVLADQKHDFAPSDGSPGASTGAYFTGSFQEMFSRTCSILASDKATTITALENYATTANTLNTSRDSVAGVDLNDEAANMMQYQKSYSAAARLMTTIDEALDKLINSTGVVGR